MTLREAVRELLVLELGDTEAAYEIRNTESSFDPMAYSFKYEFETELGTGYEVSITGYRQPGDPAGLNKYAGVTFVDDNRSYTHQTGEHDVYRVMATVIKAARVFWENEREKIEKAWGARLQGFAFSGVGATGKSSGQKNRIYKRFVKAKFPNATIEDDPNAILVKL